jgi:hypothetical protein
MLFVGSLSFIGGFINIKKDSPRQRYQGLLPKMLRHTALHRSTFSNSHFDKGDRDQKTNRILMFEGSHTEG